MSLMMLHVVGEKSSKVKRKKVLEEEGSVVGEN